MQLLDGKLVSTQILLDLTSRIKNLKTIPSLHVILVGDDPSSLKYVSLKEKRAQEIGISFTLHHLPVDTDESTIIALIDSLNNDPQVTGFFIQLPLPQRNKILDRIDPLKDVDGLNPNSSYSPAVVNATIRLLDHYHLSVSGKNAVIINKSQLIGIPLQKQLQKRGCQVTLVDKNTLNIPQVSRGAELLISATGVKGLVKSDYIKQGAIVIDIGGGDVDFDQAKDKCSYITPPVGGIGPMTIACLLENLVNTAIK